MLVMLVAKGWNRRLYGCGSVVGGDEVMSVGLVVKKVRCVKVGQKGSERVAFCGVLTVVDVTGFCGY